MNETIDWKKKFDEVKKEYDSLGESYKRLNSRFNQLLTILENVSFKIVNLTSHSTALAIELQRIAKVNIEQFQNQGEVAQSGRHQSTE